MKRIYILFLLTFLTSSLWAQEMVTRSQDADSLYRAADYEGAIHGYEEILANGITSADLHYNLGNAYYRTDQIGHAILNYERALRLNPGMTDARQNLELANSKTVDRITVLPKIFLVEWYDTLVSHFAPATWRIIVIIILIIACVAVYFLVTSRSIPIRKTALASLIAAGLLLLISIWFTLVSTSRYNSHSEAIVMQGSMAVKSSPELQSVDKLILHEGTKVTISESLSDWHKITLADGTTGWCQEESIERI